MNFGKLLFCLSMAYLVAIPTLAHSQDFTYKGSAYGGIGFGRFFDDAGSLGTGLTYRVGAEWRPLHRLGFGADLIGIRFHRGDYFHVDGHSELVFANVIYYFSRSHVQPYVKGGVGILKTGYTYSWPNSSVAEYHVSKTGAAADFGTGIRFFVNRHWSVNPEFRVAGGAAWFSLVNYLSISTAYHW